MDIWATIEKNLFNNHSIKPETRIYPINDKQVQQSRATHPAWMFRDIQQMKYDIPILNPQENVCYPFENNLNTSLLEKDYFKSKRP